MPLNRNEILIDDETVNKVDIWNHARGAVPRDYSVTPVDTFGDPPSQMKLIPRSEWSDRIKEMERTESRLSDILRRSGIPSTDQNGHGYCWAYSVVGAIQTVRALNNQPHVPLNAHSVAAIIKGGRDEGGWCGLSAKFVREHGVAPMEDWPEHSRNTRLDTPEMRAKMARFRVTEDWFDLTKAAYDQELTFDQVMTCLLNRTPLACDYNYWGHSVLVLDPVEVEPGSFGTRGRNSWGEGWGDRGFFVSRGSKAIPDGAVGIRVARATA